MESLHSGAGWGSFCRFGLGERSCLRQQLLIWAIWLLVSFVLCAGGAQAQSTSYVYDANGRVVAVTANNGTSEQYSYDTLGHVSQVEAPLSPGQLAFFAFVPTHGVGGAQVTINGQGFDSTPANNAVSFNGTVAMVLSASATQLVVTVPNGATTGPISVTVGGQTVASASPFVIDNTSALPSITLVSPMIVAAGGMVTVTGTNLDPVPGNSAVQMGDVDVLSFSSLTNTQLQYAAITSGYVTLETPYGEAASASPVIVLPGGVTAASVVSSGYATSGGVPVALNVGAAGQIGAVLFEANAGKSLSLQASGITSTASNINYEIYAPGNVLIQQGTVSATSPSIHLPNLVVSGTYLATFQPDTAGAQLSIALETDAALVTSSLLPIATNTAWRSERLTFNVTTPGNVEMTLANLAVVGGSGNGIQMNVYNSSGTNVATYDCYASNPGASCRDSLWNLVAGTYSVVLTPTSGGSFQVSAVLQPDAMGPALALNTPVNVNLGVGQVERLTFNANAGDTVSLQLSAVSTTNPAGQAMYVQVYSPNGGVITPTGFYSTFNATSANMVDLSDLPASGTYTVVVCMPYGTPGSAQLTLVPGVTGTLPSSGSPQNYSADAAGQNINLSFTADAGDNMELTFANISVPGSSNGGFEVYVYDPSGTNVATYDCYASNPGASCRDSLWNLVVGTYSVVLTPIWGGSIQVSAVLQPDVMEPALTPNTPENVNLGVGQVERFTFNANAGDTDTLQLSAVSTTNPAGQAMYVQVYSPNGGVITPTGFYATFNATSSNEVNLSNLPASGTYTVVVCMPYGTPGSGQLTLVPQ
jgi:trimeric autotransporter adhesin